MFDDPDPDVSMVDKAKFIWNKFTKKEKKKVVEKQSSKSEGLVEPVKPINSTLEGEQLCNSCRKIFQTPFVQPSGKCWKCYKESYWKKEAK